MIRNSAALTDLSSLASLFAAADHSLSFALQDAPALTSPAGLGTASKGSYELADLPLLTDLQPLSQVKTLDALSLRNIPLTSLTGLGPLVGGSVRFQTLPVLGSLKGLDKFATGTVSFIDLPLVTSLAPLVGLVDAGSLVLQGMPLVTSLAGRDNLETAFTVSIGDCINEGTSGMDGLTSLTGLGSLTSTGEFMVTNSKKLTSLAGVGALAVVSERLAIINNPKLPKAAFDALLVQVDEPAMTCFGDWGVCDCIEIMPP